MLESVKKAMYTGLGMASLTKEKLEELVTELAKKGELSEQEGKEIFAEVAAKTKEAKDKLESQVRQLVKESLAKMNLVSKEDLAALERKVAELEEEIKGRESEE